MSAFTPPDAAAREVAADPARNIILRASAGTGKTTVLVTRYLRLLDHGAPPRHILALTFTRKAAQEMKDRIVKELRAPERRRSRGATADLADVNVLTIDAFNLGLLREFPLDAGLPPGMEVLDERAMPVVRAEAIRGVLTGAAGLDRETLGDLPLLLDRGASKTEEALRSYLEKRLTWRRYFEDEVERLNVRPRLRLRDAMAPVADDCEALASAPETPLPVRLALRLEDQPASRDALDIETLSKFFKNKTPPKGSAPAAKGPYKAARPSFLKLESHHRDRRNDIALRPFWRVCQAVEAEYQRLKRDRGVMDFDDLTLAATRLLSRMDEFGESRFRLEARYHHLLLDEFHDTSDHQWELLEWLVQPWLAGEGLAAEEVTRVTRGRLRRPTIFLVGDHKQSIYRFRDARVEILGRAERKLRELETDRDPRQVLRWNFRSVRSLRRFVNRAAKDMAPTDPPGEERDWAFRYDGSDEFPEGAGPMDDESASDLAVAVAVGDPAAGHDAVARRIANRIRDLVREHGAAPESIALLARSANRLGAYRTAVEELGIPTHLTKGQDFYQTSEMRDIAALARFLARPFSDRRAVELLCSRFFATPFDSLARLKRAARSDTPFADLARGDASAVAEASGAWAARLRDASQTIAGWVRLSRRRSPSRTVDEALRATDYLRRAQAAAPNPEAQAQIAANLLRARQQLAAFERSGLAGLEEVAQSLAGAEDGDATQAPVHVGGAVQAMSIHASKGLEFDHVFLVDCGNPGQRATGIPRVQELEDGVWTIALIKDASPWKLDDGGRAESEERRCLYVAMTRAKRTLTLSWVTRFKKDGDPWAPQGLASFLPPELYRSASLTALEPADALHWRGEDIAVLPLLANDSGDGPATRE